MLDAEQLGQGLHRLKDECDTYARLPATIDCILRSFNEVLIGTHRALPGLRSTSRHGPDAFCLRPRGTQFGPQSDEEIRLERSLAQTWPVATGETRWFLSGSCRGFQSYQVPTTADQSSEGWGDIDLLGVSESWMPQVWELKKVTRDTSPFHQILQGIAYGLVIRQAWNDGELASAWKAARPETPVVTKIAGVEVFGIAPTEYWEIAREKWLSTPKLRGALQALIEGSKAAGFPVTLVEFDATKIDTEPFFEVGAGSKVEPWR